MVANNNNKARESKQRAKNWSGESWEQCTQVKCPATENPPTIVAHLRGIHAIQRTHEKELFSSFGPYGGNDSCYCLKDIWFNKIDSAHMLGIHSFLSTKDVSQNCEIFTE